MFFPKDKKKERKSSSIKEPQMRLLGFIQYTQRITGIGRELVRLEKYLGPVDIFLQNVLIIMCSAVQDICMKVLKP